MHHCENKRSRASITRQWIWVTAAILAVASQVPAAAQPGFEDYYFDSPLRHYQGDVRTLYFNDPKGFRATYLPKTRIPLNTEDYFGIWNYLNHKDSWPRSGDPLIPYDNHSRKKTYVTDQGNPHDAVDWLVSFRNWGQNEVINPFPRGAVVEVTSVNDVNPDIPDNWSAGNSLDLVCYLDGDATNQSSFNKYQVSFWHLKQHSVLVQPGDFVQFGQVLAQVGNSGLTGLEVTHIHTRYIHYGTRLDPFKGRWNKNIQESLLFDQAWVEHKTNYHTTENRKHLTLNDAFSVEMPNRSWNTYVFKAFSEIEAIRVGDGQGGIEPGYDVLANPNLRDLNRKTSNFIDNDGKRHTLYEVSFRWYQDAHPSVIDKDIEFLIETPDGERSNRVFVVVRD